VVPPSQRISITLRQFLQTQRTALKTMLNRCLNAVNQTPSRNQAFDPDHAGRTVVAIGESTVCFDLLNGFLSPSPDTRVICVR